MTRPRLVRRCLPAILLAAAASAIQAADPPAVDRYAAGRELVIDIDRIVTPNGVQETLEVPLGGVKQVVDVRGADRANPILLFVHGGPASVEMPISWSFQRPWEDFFTVVQWDQRGAGRSYRLTDPKAIAPTLARERYVDDAIELIEFLQRRYGPRPVVVMGHSWGSIVGLSVAMKRPDLLAAYVGVGQVLDFRENERQGFEWTLREARARHDDAAVRTLEAMRPYPGDGAFDLAKVGAEREINVRYGGLAAGRDSGDFYFHAGRLSPAYTHDDLVAWDAGSEFTMGVLFPHLAAITFANEHSVRCPVVMMLGRQDWTTPSGITADWMASLDAPVKKVDWFEHSAHLPFLEEPGRFLQALLRDVLPLAAR